MRVHVVTRYLGLMVLGYAFLAVPPILFAWSKGETAAGSGFAYSLVLSVLLGSALFAHGRMDGASGELGRKEALCAVALAWLIIPSLGAIPFVLGVGTSWLDGLFESVSGFTTAGASIMTDVESLPDSINFWRCFSQWIGGVGIVAILVAVMPEMGIGARHMFHMESSLDKEGFVPRIRATATRLLGIYLALSILLALLLWAAGMPWIDSILHMMTALPTGGFSNKNASIGAYSDRVAWAVMAAMVVGAINFSLFHAKLRGRKKVFRANEEFKWYIAILVLASVLVSMDYFFRQTRPTWGRAITDGTFSVLTVGSTTGFGTYDFDRGSSFTKLILLVLMFIGGCSGSTAGGLKVSRLILCVKSASIEIRKYFGRFRVAAVRVDDRIIDPESRSIEFGVLYLRLFAIGASTLVVALSGLDFEASVSGTLACLASVGPGFSTIGPASNFAAVPAAAKIVFIADMLLGRLEFIPLLAIFFPRFWRI